MDRWAGRVALVTGASRGIGFSLAKKLVMSGMKVVGCARNIQKIQELANDLKDAPGSLTAIKCDVAKEAEIESMFANIKSTLGGVDVCINNAAIVHDAPLLSGDPKDWRHMLDVNVLGVCICTKAAVNSMKERGVDDGHIILINSVFGHYVPSISFAHFYSAAKHAVTAITEGLRNELREMKSDIRVSSVSPGMVETGNIIPALGEEVAKKFYSEHRTLQADDIDDVIIYILGAPSHVQVHELIVRPTQADI